MNRRTFFTSTAALGLSAGTASAGIFGDVWTAITGHVDDIKDRRSDDTFAPGAPIKTSKFRENDPGQDVAHWVTGLLFIVEYQGTRYVQLGTDFEAGLAPDLYIYVSTTPNIIDEDSFFNSEQIELGKLTKGSGASFYELPPNIDPSSVTIWCKAFSQFMGSANV